MTLPQLSIQRPVLAIVMNLVIVLVGLIAWDRLAVRLVPKVDLPVVTVNTTYPGANAQVVESQITTPIEEALVRRGDLSPALAERVRDALAASGCPHRRVDAA